LEPLVSNSLFFTVLSGGAGGYPFLLLSHFCSAG